jgi:hypothetical protein
MTPAQRKRLAERLRKIAEEEEKTGAVEVAAEFSKVAGEVERGESIQRRR